MSAGLSSNGLCFTAYETTWGDLESCGQLGMDHPQEYKQERKRIIFASRDLRKNKDSF